MKPVIVKKLNVPKCDKCGGLLPCLACKRLEDMEGESPQSRLRAVIFVWWEECANLRPPIAAATFEAFYSQQMEKIIEGVKRKNRSN